MHHRFTYGSTTIVSARLRTGTLIFDSHDERFVGRLDCILPNGDHRATFENGLRADIPERRVRVASLPHRVTSKGENRA